MLLKGCKSAVDNNSTTKVHFDNLSLLMSRVPFSTDKIVKSGKPMALLPLTLVVKNCCSYGICTDMLIKTPKGR